MIKIRRNSIAFRMISGLAITAGLLTVAAFPLSASAISLKQNSVIEGNTITLGDVFHGLPSGGDKVLGPAPLPGSDMVLNARTLLRIAVAMDLPWRPAGNSDYVVLSRAGSAISQDMVKDALKARMKEDGIPGHFLPAFSASLPQVVLPPDQPAQVEISSLSVNPQTRTFDATVAAPSVANPVQTFRVSGALHRMVEIPVLAETLSRGTIIGRNDIQMIEMREDHLKDSMIIDANVLIGMTPRRLISAGQPVHQTDVDAPRAVSRGDIVTMVFTEGGMTLTARGKALEHGAKGDTIRVVNTSSDKTIEAEVTASKEVTVRNF